MKTSSRPTSQASVPSSGPPTSPSPISSARTVSTTSVIGLTFANASSQPGIESAGTNAEDTNVNGKTQMKPADCAVSGSFTDSPTNALIHENTYENAST